MKEINYGLLPSNYRTCERIFMAQFNHPFMNTWFFTYALKELCHSTSCVAIWTIRPKEVIPNYDPNYDPCI
jgi:hypothetical protein